VFEFFKYGLLKRKDSLQSNIDLHSHFIPDIDDGSESIKESLTLIRQMKNLGYKKLITTPHIMSHRYPNDIKTIKNGLFELRSILKVENIDIELEAAAEYYCDEHFFDLIQKKELLSFGENYILFEFSYTTRPVNLEKCVKALIVKGYKPVLAHPERYRFLKDVTCFRNLKKLGMLFQINVNSLNGFYGQEAQKKSLMLGQKGMVDFIGSDIHHQKNLDAYKKNIVSNHVEMIFRNNKILNKTL